MSEKARKKNKSKLGDLLEVELARVRRQTSSRNYYRFIRIALFSIGLVGGSAATLFLMEAILDRNLLSIEVLRSPTTFAFVLMAGTGVIGFALISYLQGPRSRIPQPSIKANQATDNFELYMNLRKHLDYLKSQMKDLSEEVHSGDSTLDDKERKLLVESLKERLKKEASQNLLGEIRKEIEAEHHDRNYSERTRSTINRLLLQTEALGRRGIVNLVGGILVTIAGLLVLAWAVFKAPQNITDPWMIVAYYLPRLTLVILIEGFAYFFLRLYKGSLAEIKYFQNELTNVELKFIALQRADQQESEDTINSILELLAKTDRNFVSEKGQSTVELEKNRISQVPVNEATKAMS